MIGKGAKNLPKEAIPPCSRGRLTAVIAAALIIVAVFNIVAWWYLERYTPNTGYLLIRAKWALLASLKKPIDLLILGDSSGNQGVDPETLRDNLGITSVNLCTIGDALVLNDAWMLEEYIGRFGPPRAVLVVHGYDMWSRDINVSVLSKIPGSWWRRRPDLGFGVKNRIRVILNRYVPLYAETASLGWVIRHPGSAFPSRLPMRPDGFMVETTAEPDRVKQDVEVHLQFIRQQERVLSDVNRAALRLIVQLAEANDFDLCLVPGPIYDSLASDSAFLVYFAAVRDTLAAVTASSPHTRFLLTAPVTFPAERMQSADHIVGSAAAEFTSRLAERMRSMCIDDNLDSSSTGCR